MLGGDERVMRQLLQHFGHQRRGDAVLLGDFIGTASVLLAVHRQVLDGNQTVVGFLGKLEHCSRDFLNAPEYATDSVAYQVYPQRGSKVKPKRSLLLLAHRDVRV